MSANLLKLKEELNRLGWRAPEEEDGEEVSQLGSTLEADGFLEAELPLSVVFRHTKGHGGGVESVVFDSVD